MSPAHLPPVFIGHEIYRGAGYGAQHPLGIARVGPVMDLCGALGWLGPGEFQTSPVATEDELAQFHHRAYIAALREACAQRRVDAAVRERHRFGTMENPWFEGLFDRAATSVGGAIHAARLALSGRIVFHPAGGTHHGRPDRASGFCYFNDPVFAIATLLEGGIGRLLYVDLDAHHCDAVQDAFAEDPRVYTVSIHEAGRWPHTGAVDDRGAGRACNLPVPRDCHDDELALIMDAVLRPLAHALAPDAVVLTCGADALAGDPLTKLAFTNRALWDCAVELASLAPAAVVQGGGGYNPWTVARYWTGLWGRLSGRAVPDGLPAAACSILEQLSCDLVDADEIEPHWLTTLADPAGPPRLVRPELQRVVDAVIALLDRRMWRLDGLRSSLANAP